MYRLNIKRLKNREKKINLLGTLGLEDWHGSESLGFYFASCIPESRNIILQCICLGFGQKLLIMQKIMKLSTWMKKIKHANTKMHMLELSDKHFKPIIKMLQEIMNTYEINETKKKENLSEEIVDVKRNKMEILELNPQ